MTSESTAKAKTDQSLITSSLIKGQPAWSASLLLTLNSTIANRLHLPMEEIQSYQLEQLTHGQIKVYQQV